MKIQEAAENYLETIFMLQKSKGQVRSVDIANEMGYSKPTISEQMKKFKQNEFITIDADGFILLTTKGRTIAEQMYERHEVIAKILMHIGVDEKTAYQDSCRIEHALSVKSFEKLKQHFLDQDVSL